MQSMLKNSFFRIAFQNANFFCKKKKNESKVLIGELHRVLGSYKI